MKKSNLLFAIFLFLSACFKLQAQAPQGFNYQCIVRDVSNTPVANQTVTLLFSLRNGDPAGPVVYAESHTLSTNDFGLVNLIIGNGTPSSGVFNNINWADGSKYLKVFVLNGTVATELGTSQLMSVPYALYAGNGGGTGGSYTPGAGITITGNTIANSGDTNAADDITTSSTAAGDVTGAFANLQIAPNAVTATEIADGAVTAQKIAQNGAATGQVLKWSGSAWIPSNDIEGTGTGTSYTAGPGISIASGVITNTGDGDNSAGNEIQTLAVAGNQLTISGTGGNTVTLPVAAYTPGAGIAITGNTIANSGDTNAADDITTSSTAAGDVTGAFANLQIAPNAVTATEIADGAVTAQKIAQNGAATGQVLKWSGSAWIPSNDIEGTGTGTSYTAGPGISIASGVITNTGDGDNSAGNEIQTLAVAGNQLTISGTGGNTVTLPVAAYTPGAGIAITGNTIANSGDTNAADDITTSSTAAGDVTGAFANLQIAPNAVTATEIADGAVTAQKIAQNGAATGQVLKWSGSAWIPSNDIEGTGTGTSYTAGPGISIASGVITNTGDGDNSAGNEIQTLAVAGNQLTISGTGGNTVTLPVAAYTPGAGIAITGNTIANSGDTNAADDITTSSTAAGDVTGAFANLQIAPNAVTATEIADGAVTAQKIAQNGAATGQVLKWSGSAWIPSNDIEGTGTGTSYTAGPGISIASGVITNTGDGDNSAGNEIQTLAVAGNQLTISGTGGNTVTLPVAAYTPGAGIAITGNTIANSGDTNAADDITTSSTAAGDVTGAFANLQIAPNAVTATEIADGAVTAQKIAQNGAATGQVLSWSGSAWTPSTPAPGGLTLPYEETVNIGTGVGDVFKITNTNAATSIAGVNTNGIGVYGGSETDFGGYFESQTGNGAFFSSHSGNASIITDKGYVGIGTPAPASTLSVFSESGQSDFEVRFFGGEALARLGSANGTKNAPEPKSINSHLASLAFTGYTGVDFSAGAVIRSTTREAWSSTARGASLDFRTVPNGSILPQTRMTIDHDGSVAIADTPDDEVLLQVGSDLITNRVGAVIGEMTGSGNAVWGINHGMGAGIYGVAENGVGGFFQSSTNGIALHTGTGKVGIGTYNVDGVQMAIDKPHVNAPFAFLNPIIRLRDNNSDAGGSAGIQFSQNGTANNWYMNASVESVNTADNQILFVYENATPAQYNFPLVLKGNGSVGVGTSQVGDYAMKVQHGSYGLAIESRETLNNWELLTGATNNLNLYYNGTFRGAFNSSSGLYSTSDRRLKSDIKPLRATLEGIKKLRPSDYIHADNTSSGERSIGFIAQELNEVFPEVVQHKKADERDQDIFMVNYGLMSVITVKAIQEQQELIEQLKQENAQLRSANEANSQRLRHIETVLGISSEK